MPFNLLYESCNEFNWVPVFFSNALGDVEELAADTRTAEWYPVLRSVEQTRARVPRYSDAEKQLGALKNDIPKFANLF